MPKAGVKISDEQFLSILRENAGLYALTAKAISKQFNCEYSRQAVAQRAENNKEILKDIREESLDIAEAGLQSMIRLSSTPPAVKLKAIELFLKTIGKARGYVDKTEIDMTSNGESMNLSHLTYEQLTELANKLSQNHSKGESKT